MKYFLLSFLLVCAFTLSAQEEQLIDVVETQNGIRYEGTILHYEYGKLLTMQLPDGEEVEILEKDIRRIRYDKTKMVNREETTEEIDSYFDSWKSELNFPKIERRFRYSLTLGMNGGKQEGPRTNFFNSNQRLFGFFTEGFVHYTIRPWLQLGAGVGFDRFNTRARESVLSYLGNVQLLPSAGKRLAPLLKLTAGYGKPMDTKSIELDEATGGLLLHPGVGLRVGAVNETFFTIDLGYRLLETETRRRTVQGIEIRNNNYRRFSLRIGATF